MKYIKTYEKLEYKSKIDELDLSRKNLTELPDLSEYTNLKELVCSYNQLTSLSELPNSLTDLYCHNNQLTSLPELPNTLKYLNCTYNQLTSLPELPDSLKIINCHSNQLTSLPELPDTLNYLYCYNNQLTSLPELPESLKYLYCNDNQLPFEDLEGYKEWYKNNKHIIETNGLEYVYQLYHNTNKYNL